MTKQLIEITFNSAMNQATKLDNCAASLRRIASSDISATRADLLAAWEGDNANAYVSKLDLTSGNILETAKKLENIASTLRSVARTFRDAELKALEIATLRSYE